MLKQRLIFGALGIVAALFVLLFCSVNVISLCVGVIALIGMYEFFKVTGLVNKKTPALYLGFVFALVLYTVAIFNSGFLKENLMPFIAAYVFILMVSMVLFHSNLTFSDAALSFLGTLYISIFFLHIIFIRQSELGNLNIWLIFISAWATDTFAYFAGRTLGKHKLCPKVSPKKTVEGAIGGTLGCVICICIYAYICGKCKGVSVNYISATIFSVLTAVFSQFGDLAASRIKREYGVKDYGNLIPGHGGILDRFDSALLISPLVYYFT
ncbi:MAG: phosphatidate cytidylyltransferase, partial [Clostridia bacterium]|nr:phosphatidate cytidylyltransferase [Clostridia bacterium]